MPRPETERREACAGRRAAGRRGAGDSAGGGAVGLEGHERLCSSHAHISPDGGGLQAIRTLEAMIDAENDPGAGQTAQAAE